MKLNKNRKVEKWDILIKELEIDVSRSVNYITSNQIKEFAKEEPRLMAKMDKYSTLPKIFKDNDLFLLPTSRKGYAIVKGEGYHTLESIDTPIELHQTSKPFPDSALGIESESVFLDYANSCGLLEKLCDTKNMISSFRGRTTTPKFTMKLKNSSIILEIDRAQIEVDASYETTNEIMIFEAKIGNPDSFNIRQLYYPFRTFYGKKKIRNFFFYLIPDKQIYMFWEYDFNPHDQFNSIKLINSRKYQIKLSKTLSIKNYQKVRSDEQKMNIPQADDVNKIIQFPLRVFEGYDTSKKMTDAFGFVKRQSSYYRHASELLGLVLLDNKKYKLTNKGEEFLRLTSEQKSNFICRLLLEFPIMNEIFLKISINKDKIISRSDIIDILEKKSDISGYTLKRRAQTIVSWFRWIRNNIGLVEVDCNGNIRIARQLKFEI